MRILLPWLAEFVRLPADLGDLLRERAGVGVEAVEGDVLDLEITPNRPDLLSHLGLAREVAALAGRRVRPPAVSFRAARPPVRRLVSVRVDDRRACARYAGAVIEGVRVGASPEPIRARLEACGIARSRTVVDVTNYVLWEMGHPLHAFDLDRLEGGGVAVRRARPGETIDLLDGTERELTRDDLVIADARGPVALAGVMGGARTGVTEATTRILLEAAWFDPATVRRTSKRLDVRTESSYRFERGTDRAGLATALRRAVRLVLETAGGRAARGILEAGGPGYPSGGRVGRAAIAYDPARAAAFLGAGGPAPAAHAAILRRIGARVARRGRRLAVTPPSWRIDIAAPEDLAEEVARLWGYERFGETLAPIDAPAGLGRPFPPDVQARRAAVRTLRRALAAAGLGECATFPFEPRGDVRLANPLRAGEAYLRAAPWGGLLRAVRANLDRGASGAALFEVGRLFHRGRGADAPVVEECVVEAVLAGEALPPTWRRPGVRADVAAARGIVEAALGALSIAPAWRVDGAGLVADVAEIRRIDADTVGILFRLDAIARAARPPAHAAIPRFPPAVRDVALVVPPGRPAGEVEAALRSGAGDLLESLDLFDLYEMPDGRRSLAWRLTFRAADRTLEADEVERRVAEAVGRAAALGAVLRGPAGA